MKKVLLLFTVCCMGVSSLNAQSDYKKWLKSEKKDATYTRKEIKKAAKEYAELIYEDAKEVFKERDNFADKSVKKKVFGANYPKLSYSGGKELKVEYDDRIDYYRFENDNFSYCGSVKKIKEHK